MKNNLKQFTVFVLQKFKDYLDIYKNYLAPLFFPL